MELTFDDESLERLVHWAGGDLNLLHRLAGLTLERVGRSSGDGEGVEFRRASAGVRRITPEDIDESVATLVPETGVIRDEALRRILFLVEEDRRTLQLVLDLLETEPRRFEQGHAEEVLLQAFGITYPELSGALALGRSSGAPTSWRFRHRLARRLAEVYLTPRRAVRLHVSYGEFEAAERQARRVLTRVRALFTEGRLDFEDSGLADVLLALTNHIYASASDETAYQYMALLLTEAFGCEDLAYYEYVQPDNALKAPKFLSHLFSANSGQTLDLGSTSHQLAREVRAYKSRLFFSDDRDGDRVRVAFPLKSLGGLVTAVIGATLADRRDGAITVGFKVQTIQKALNPINIALNRVEVTLKNRIIDSAQLVRGGRARGLLPVFVAHKFNAELLGNMRDHLGRASKALDFSYVDEREASGLLLPAIRRAIESCGLALYEVTKPNNNVYFEIGLGLGLNRPGLLFRRKVEDSGRPSMPTLLAPLMRLQGTETTRVCWTI